MRRRTPPGAPPGTLIADPAALAPVIRFIGYGADEMEEHEVRSLDELPGRLDRWPVAWVNVDGLGDIELIKDLGELFGLHRLALEDVVNVHQRPKVEEYEDHLFIVIRMLVEDSLAGSEQICLFLGERYLLTFQERRGDCFEMVRERLRKGRGLIRQGGPDYLAYALLDAVTDEYFPALEAMGERLERLEVHALGRPNSSTFRRAHHAKRQLLSLRRNIWPQRELYNTLSREHTPFIGDRTRIYLRDCYDHAVQLMDMVETYRDIASSLIDLYLGGVNARMNETMRVLTVIATVFMPLGFIASLYGMNFDTAVSPWNMPELKWTFGYPFVLLLMLVIAVAMLGYFRWRGWLGGEGWLRDVEEPPPGDDAGPADHGRT
ncbi:MAG TPA: magnesium/cobalt transporter CorA [Alphaproteobacteria bacterium]|nr:magnesium/cobalt transporter CorA [Alphaproteobacteria bacterium]